MFFRVLFARSNDVAKACARSRSNSTIGCLMSCTQLERVLQEANWHENYRLLDAQWDLDDGNYRGKHIAERIKGAKFFSFDECRNMTSPYPRMLPSPDVFSEYVTDLGIRNKHHVIIYDNHAKFAVYSSARVWWMFRSFGHVNVSVVDGGLRKWILDGKPTVSGEYSKEEIYPAVSSRFEASFNKSWVKDFEFVRENSNSTGPTQLMDARGRSRYLGLDGPGGHIPDSLSVPFAGFMDTHNHCLVSKDNIKTYFQSCGVDLTDEAVATCGSGVTACVLSLALQHACDADVAVYDGSWTEWNDRATPDSCIKGA